jgi:recombination protein RecT
MSKIAKIPNDFRELLEKSKGQLEVALAGSIPADKFLRVAITNIQNTPKLLECTQVSVLGAIMEAAQLGLSLDQSLGEASIVPFKNVAKMIPGYRGLIKLACESGHISHMQARIFYKNEYDSGNFQWEEGTNPSIHHIPMPPSERGEPMGVYSVAKLSDGGTSSDLMWAEDIERIMNSAPGAKFADSAWKTSPAEMWRKSVVRRHIKYMPLSPKMQRAVSAAVKDEYFDAGIIPDVPLTAPKPTIAIEEGEKVAEASDAPIQEERSSSKGSKQQKPKGTSKDGKKVDDKPSEPVPEPEPERPADPEPAAEPEAELNPIDEAIMQVKANIRELAENLGTFNDEPHRIQMDQCGDDIEKLNTYRLKLVRELNTKLNG